MNCQATNFDGKNGLFQLKLNTQCGSIIQQNGKKVKYSNSIWFNDVTQDSFKFIANVTCLYVNGLNLPIIDRPTYEKNIEISLDLFRDSDFSNSSRLNAMVFPSVQAGQYIFIEINYKPTQSVNDKLNIYQCHLSQLFSSHHLAYTIIDNSCNGTGVDETVEIIKNTLSKTQLKFQVFKWSKVKAEFQHFYLFCSFYNCGKNCSKSNNEKICSTNYTSSSSFGPFFTEDFHHIDNKRDPNKNEETSEVQVDDKDYSTAVDATLRQVTGITCGSFLVISIVAISCVMRKKIRGLYIKKIASEDRIRRGFSFILRSSKDVPLVVNEDAQNYDYSTMS